MFGQCSVESEGGSTHGAGEAHDGLTRTRDSMPTQLVRLHVASLLGGVSASCSAALEEKLPVDSADFVQGHHIVHGKLEVRRV